MGAVAFPATIDRTGHVDEGQALQDFLLSLPSGTPGNHTTVAIPQGSIITANYVAARLELQNYIDILSVGSALLRNDAEGTSHVSNADHVRAFRIRQCDHIRVSGLSLIGPMSQYLDDYDNWHGQYNADLENRTGYMFEGCTNVQIDNHCVFNFMGDAWSANPIGKGNRMPFCTIGAGADRMTVQATDPTLTIATGAQDLTGRMCTGAGIPDNTFITSVAPDKLSCRISKPAAALSTPTARGEVRKLSNGNRDGAFTVQAQVLCSNILVVDSYAWNLGRHICTPQGCAPHPTVLDSQGTRGRGIELLRCTGLYSHGHHFIDAQSDYDYPNEIMVNIATQCQGDPQGSTKWQQCGQVNQTEGVASDGVNLKPGGGSSKAWPPVAINPFNPAHSPWEAFVRNIRAKIPVQNIIPPPDFVNQPIAPAATIGPGSAIVKWGSTWPIDTCNVHISQSHSGQTLTGSVIAIPNSSVIYDAQRNNMEIHLTGLASGRWFIAVTMTNVYGTSPQSNVPNNPFDIPTGGGGGGSVAIIGNPSIIAVDDTTATMQVTTNLPSVLATRSMLGGFGGTWIAGPSDNVARTVHTVVFTALTPASVYAFEATVVAGLTSDVGTCGTTTAPAADTIPDIVPGSVTYDTTSVPGTILTTWVTDYNGDSTVEYVEQSQYGNPAAVQRLYDPVPRVFHGLRTPLLKFSTPYVVKVTSNP